MIIKSKKNKNQKLENFFFEKTGKKYPYHDKIEIYGKIFYRFSIPDSKDGELVLMSEQGDLSYYDPDCFGD